MYDSRTQETNLTLPARHHPQNRGYMIQKRRILLITLLLLGLVGLIFIIGSSQKSNAIKIVYINGIQDCSEDIDSEVQKQFEGHLYGFVQAANDHNRKSSQPTYDGEVRDDSCKQSRSKIVRADTGEKITVYRSSVIVDIAEAKQSWRISYDWLKSGNGLKTDLGSLEPNCLSDKELKYGNFNCQAALNVLRYGVPVYDPILEFLPYTGEGFTLTYGAEAKQVIATISIPSKERDNQELIENNKSIIPYWFEKRGLDINKYTVSYRVIYE